MFLLLAVFVASLFGYFTFLVFRGLVASQFLVFRVIFLLYFWGKGQPAPR
jgi:hypothetical protein